MSSEIEELKVFIGKGIAETQRQQAEGIAALRQEVLAAIDNHWRHTLDLVTNVKEGLEREMHAEADRINPRFDAMQARLDRQGGILQSGVKWTARMSKWSEDIDRIIVDRDNRMDRLEASIHRLEGPNHHDNAV